MSNRIFAGQCHGPPAHLRSAVAHPSGLSLLEDVFHRDPAGRHSLPANLFSRAYCANLGNGSISFDDLCNSPAIVATVLHILLTGVAGRFQTRTYSPSIKR